jgi:O-antigen/teichoic acid export membrane protein
MTEIKTATSKGIAKNILYSSSTWILPLGLSFLTTPVIVRSLGNEDYGIYALVLGFIAYSFNFNIGRALTKYVAEYRASGENEKIRDVISATFFINIMIGLTGLAIIGLSANWLVVDVFKIEPASQTKTVYALYLSGFIIFFTMMAQVFTAILHGIQRFDVFSKIFNVYNFFLIGGNLLLALSGFKLIGLLTWNLLITFPTCFVIMISVKKLLPEFGIGLGFKRGTLKLVLNYSWGVIVYQILANVLLLFERSWITRSLGAESLTFYVVPMMLAVYMHGFISSLMMVVFPLASELKDDKAKLLRLYLQATKIVTFLTIFLSLTLMAESRTFLTLWMNPNFAENSSNLLVLHTITFGLSAISIISWYMTDGLGYPNYNCLVFVICFIISITGMVWLTKDFGNIGIASARLAGFGTIFLSIFYVEHWFFKRVQFRFWMKLIASLGFAALIAGLVEKLLIQNLPLNWIVFVGSVISGGLVYSGVLWLTGFISEEEKQLFRRLIKKNSE